jgi:hypothetical protein
VPAFSHDAGDGEEGRVGSKMRVRTPTLAWTNVCIVTAVAIASSVSASAVPSPTSGVCSVITNADIFRLLGWHVDHVRKRSYHFGSMSGRMCNYESSQGIVTTIVPDSGTPFPGISADNTPDAGDLVQTLPGFGARVQVFNGTVFVTRNRTRVAVRVVPESNPASYADVEPFAKVIVSRFP